MNNKVHLDCLFGLNVAGNDEKALTFVSMLSNNTPGFTHIVSDVIPYDVVFYLLLFVHWGMEKRYK